MSNNFAQLCLLTLSCVQISISLGIYKLGKDELVTNGNMESDRWSADYQWWPLQAKVSQIDGVKGKAAAITDKATKWGLLGQWLKGDRALQSGYYYMEAYIKLLNHPTVVGYDWFMLEMMFNYRDKDDNDIYFRIAKYPRLRNTDGWVKIAGEFEVPQNTSRQRVYFSSSNSQKINFAVDEVSLRQIIPDEDWETAANEMIDEHRKGDVNVNVKINYNLDPSFVNFKIRQLKHDFKLGAYVRWQIINGTWYSDDVRQRYQDFFYNTFNSGTPTMAYRWRVTEYHQDKPWFLGADRATYSLNDHGMNIVGHTVFWNEAGYWPNWFKALSADEKVDKMEKRAKDIVGRYKGRVNQWIVSRDSISRKGEFEKYTNDYDILTKMFNWTKAADDSADLILSDRFIMKPPNYASAVVNQIKTLKEAGHSPIVDAQGSFEETDIVDPIRIAAILDILAQGDAPIMVSQFHVRRKDVAERAKDIETFMRVAFAQPKVESISFSGFWDGNLPTPDTSLVDSEDFNINQAGWTLKRLFQKEWRTDGYLTLPEKRSREQTSSFRAFYGDYEMDVFVCGELIETRKFGVHKGTATEINVEINEPEETETEKRSVDVYGTIAPIFAATYGLN